MKATGIIVEYNPFHNGHKLHSSTAKNIAKADVVIAVMSGNFLQRGEPAFTDKWTRTEMALRNGVDLVFELPYTFATAHAPKFAEGAIKLLDAACCDTYCFGSEEGHILPFENSLSLLQEQHMHYETVIQDAIAQGFSYPKALNLAYQKVIDENLIDQPFVDLSKPNNILGFHYMQAAKEIDSKMIATTIERVGAAYHDEQLHDQKIGSATGIRKNFFDSNHLNEVENFIPNNVHDLLKTQQEQSVSFGRWASFYPILRMMIIRDGPQRLTEIADITEGIENLFYRAALQHANFDSFMQVVKSKRYTWTRIQRMLTHIFTGYTYEMRATSQTPTYLRLLGMTQTGRLYLHQNKSHFKLPIVSKVSSISDAALDIDIHATNMYALGINEQAMINADFKRAPIIID